MVKTILTDGRIQILWEVPFVKRMSKGHQIIHATYYSSESGVEMDIDDWNGQQEINAYQTFLDDAEKAKQLKITRKLLHRGKNIAHNKQLRKEALRKKTLKKLVKEMNNDNT